MTVRTASGEYGALSQRDVELARRISVEARRLQVEPDPSQVQVIGIAVAQDAGSDVGPFWAAVLGYKSLGADEDVVDRHRRNPHVSFQRLHPPKPGRGRTHIDVSVPADQAEARVAAALAAGGRLADETQRPTGGRSLRPRTTASTSRPGRISKTTTADDGRHLSSRGGRRRMTRCGPAIDGPRWALSPSRSASSLVRPRPRRHPRRQRPSWCRQRPDRPWRRHRAQPRHPRRHGRSSPGWTGALPLMSRDPRTHSRRARRCRPCHRVPARPVIRAISRARRRSPT